MTLAVAFLARGIGGGLSALERFLASWRAHPAGVEHQLWVLTKGWDGIAGLDAARSMARDAGAGMLDLPDDGYDWGAYFRAAAQIEAPAIAFLNTHSRIERPGWLRLLAEAAALPGAGMAGCTGSWGTIAPMRRFIVPIARDIARARGPLRGLAAFLFASALYPGKWLLQAGRYPAFPNPHLRSNAFLVRRNEFLAFAAVRRLPRTKRDAFALESGREGLARFLTARGLSLVLAAADGVHRTSDAWIDAHTFRIPGQDNLLVSDNQTRAYDAAGRHEKRIMELSAWGRCFTP